MPRFFIEVSYKGTAYAGFQKQTNANSIQAEVEKAFKVFYKTTVQLTGSSRTDAGVHALQNFFHFDVAGTAEKNFEKDAYHLNAILPADIVIKGIYEVASDLHCRFNAKSREYVYTIYQKKNPFLQAWAYYYPYKLNKDLLNSAAEIVKKQQHFNAFSKKHSQVKTFECHIIESAWSFENEKITYQVKANRFLRGMVRALVATMLQAGRENLSLEAFKELFENKEVAKADFSAPAHGLVLNKVTY